MNQFNNPFSRVAGLLPENPLRYLLGSTIEKYSLIGKGETSDFLLGNFFNNCSIEFENSKRMYIEGKKIDILKGIRRFNENVDLSKTQIKKIIN
ncbi:MAG: hypothetical protein ACOC3Z_01375 [Nanoarchaeota archaeon]